MTDIERVKEMVSEGRITAEEGDQLIKVLLEVDDANDAAIDAAYEAAMEAADQAEVMGEQDSPADTPDRRAASDATAGEADDFLGAAARAAAAAAGSVADMGRDAARVAKHAALFAAHKTAREARDSARAARDAAREAARGAREAARELRRGGPSGGAESGGSRPGTEIAPPDTRWVRIEMIAGDLDVWAVEGLTGPEVEGGPGNITVEDTADGYSVKFAPDRGGALDRFLSHVRSGDLKVRIPPDHGVVIRATAGDVDLHGVRYLRGNLTAGDLSADALEGIDFSAMAGDIDLTMLLRHGRHVLTVGAGDVEVKLDDRSQVTVDASVSIGDASADVPGFTQSRRTVGAQVGGRVGTGEAHLELRVTTGDIDVAQGRSAARPAAGTDGDHRV